MSIGYTYTSNRIAWNSVNGATQYELCRATSAQGSYKLITSSTALSYTDWNLSTGTEYFYKVRAYRSVAGRKIYSNYSAVVSSKPTLDKPASPKAARLSSTSVKVTWGAVAGRTAYEVWRRSSIDGTYTKITTTAAVEYTDTKLVTGTTYYYKVRAYRMVGSKKIYGEFSMIALATT